MIAVETYTTANGSNMDEISYKDGLSVEEIVADLRRCYTNWDYAIITFADGTDEYVER